VSKDRLFLRGDTWYCWGYDAEGDRWKKSTKQTDKQAARKVAREIERRMAAPTRASSTTTLKQAVIRLREYHVRRKSSEATKQIQECKCGHLLRILGEDFDLGTLTRELLEDYADKRIEEKASRHNVHKDLRELRQACRVSGVPWDATLMPDLGKFYEPGDTWLTVQQFRVLRMALPPERRDYVTMFAFTGIDVGPLYRLRADHVDLDGDRVWIPDTKTEARPRWVELAPEAREALEWRVRKARGDEPLFPVWVNCNRALERACKRAKVPRVSPKDLRRTFCSWMAQAGVPMKTCAEMMGHSSTRMVDLVYAKIGVDSKRDAISKLPRLRESEERVSAKEA
jgi:integrase